MSEDYYSASYQFKESHQSARLNITTTSNGVGVGIGPALDPIGPPSSFCERCRELVYPLEGLVPIMNVRYHKKCFKCSVCSTHLDLKTYHTNLVDLNDKRIYCIAHKPKDSKPLNSLYSLTDRSRSKSPGLAGNSFDYSHNSAVSSNHSHSGSTSSSTATFSNEINQPNPCVHSGVQYELPVHYKNNDTISSNTHQAGSGAIVEHHRDSNHHNSMTMKDAASILKDEIGWRDDVFTPSATITPSPSVSDSGNYALHHKEGKETNYHRKEIGSNSVTDIDRKEQENKYKYESANQSATSVSKSVDQVTHTVINAAVGDPCYINGPGVTVNVGNSTFGNKNTAFSDTNNHQMGQIGVSSGHFNHSGAILDANMSSSQNINMNTDSHLNYNANSNNNSLNRNDNYSANALINAVADDIDRRHTSSSSTGQNSTNNTHSLVVAGSGGTGGAVTINPSIKLPNIDKLNIDALPTLPGSSVLIQEKSESSQHSSSQTIINNVDPNAHIHAGNVTSITKIDKSASSSEHQVKITSGGSNINISGQLNPSIEIKNPHDKNRNEIGGIVDLVPINPPNRIPTVKPREPQGYDQGEIIGSNKGFGTVKLTVFYCDQQNRLSVTVHEAKNLIKLDKKGKSDPFARVYLLPDKKKLTKKKTKIVKDQLNPVWEETFDYQMSLAEACSRDLLVNIKDDKGLFEKQETQFMGEVLIDLRKTEIREPFTRWFYLQPRTRESELLFNSDNNTLVL